MQRGQNFNIETFNIYILWVLLFQSQLWEVEGAGGCVGTQHVSLESALCSLWSAIIVLNFSDWLLWVMLCVLDDKIAEVLVSVSGVLVRLLVFFCCCWSATLLTTNYNKFHHLSHDRVPGKLSGHFISLSVCVSRFPFHVVWTNTINKVVLLLGA